MNQVVTPGRGAMNILYTPWRLKCPTTGRTHYLKSRPRAPTCPCCASQASVDTAWEASFRSHSRRLRDALPLSFDEAVQVTGLGRGLTHALCVYLVFEGQANFHPADDVIHPATVSVV